MHTRKILGLTPDRSTHISFCQVWLRHSLNVFPNIARGGGGGGGHLYQRDGLLINQALTVMHRHHLICAYYICVCTRPTTTNINNLFTGNLAFLTQGLIQVATTLAFLSKLLLF